MTPPTIGPGSTDVASIVAAQRDLNVADAIERSAGHDGLSTCPLTEDGLFDQDTQQATIEFQLLKALTPDGIIDPVTWTLLEAMVNPPSGIDMQSALPLEGVTRWSVSMDDIAAQTGLAPTADQLIGVSVTVGGIAAANPATSPDGNLIFFTPPPSTEGNADLIVIGGDGSTFTLPNAMVYTSSFGDALRGVSIAVAVAIQEVAMNVAAMEVGRLQAFVDGAAAALDVYQDLMGILLTRLQDPNSNATVQDQGAWFAHLATHARMVADIINGQCRITLATDAIADLDGMPFGGADDEPTLDTGAKVLLMTALENVIIPSDVDLTA